MAVYISTPWSAHQPRPIPKTDEEKNEAFAAFVSETVQKQMPWLWPLLVASDAAVVTDIGHFSFSIPSDAGGWYEVPEISRLLAFLPWSSDNEIAH
ncbi:hypothetical protein [Rhodoferax bucti]|uniref:hypothetical protein n=1 Tax=Rhodoferax bucti TaxID=2576305 RepID=UPI001107E24D|nr:hypothetical protein [Rhodoferax bucti]